MFKSDLRLLPAPDEAAVRLKQATGMKRDVTQSHKGTWDLATSSQLSRSLTSKEHHLLHSAATSVDNQLRRIEQIIYLLASSRTVTISKVSALHTQLSNE